MDREFRITGGAQVGWVHASWPLAKLSVSPSALSISGLLIGTYSFTPEQVVALEPLLGNGIRILHSSVGCPAKVVFWSFGNPKRLLDEIRLSGFVPRGSSAAVPIQRGIPIRWTTVGLVIVVWNALFVLDGFVPWNAPKAPGPFVLLALAFMFATALSVQRSVAIQAWVLKPGRSVGEIRSLLLLLQVVSGIMLVVFTLVTLLRMRAG